MTDDPAALMSFWRTPSNQEWAEGKAWARGFIAKRRELERLAQREWISEVKTRLGLVTIGEDSGERAYATYEEATLVLGPAIEVRAEFGAGPSDHCRVYWGSHGCDFKRGHEGDCQCDCCECPDHPHHPEEDEWTCVAKPPYYGPETRFYGEDAEARGLPAHDE